MSSDQLDLVKLNKNQRDLIHELFKEIYPDSDLPWFHWNWMFDSPLTYLPVGIIRDGKLISFYSVLIDYENKKGSCHSSMTHPDHRGNGYFTIVSEFLYSCPEIRNLEFLELIANKNIYQLHKRNGSWIERQIKEYRIDVGDVENDTSQYHKTTNQYSKFELWRYLDHYYKDYFYYTNSEVPNKRVVLSIYQNRVQIIDYNELQPALFLADKIAHNYGCDKIAFWNERELPYPSIDLELWRTYREINGPIGVKSNLKLRMGDHLDVF